MPRRSCVGCRQVREKTVLVRLVSHRGVLAVDKKGTLPGRGVYICPKESCLDSAYRRKDLFSRALRCKLSLPPEQDLWVCMEGVKPVD